MHFWLFYLLSVFLSVVLPRYRFLADSRMNILWVENATLGHLNCYNCEGVCTGVHGITTTRLWVDQTDLIVVQYSPKRGLATR